MSRPIGHLITSHIVLTGQHPARMAERDIQQAHQCPTTHLTRWALSHPGQAEQVERVVVAAVVTWEERGYAHIVPLSTRVLDPIARFVDCRLVGEAESAGGRVGYSQYIHHMIQPREDIACGIMTYIVTTSHRNKCPTSKYSTPSLHQVCSPAATRSTAKIVC